MNENANCWDDYEQWREGCPMEDRMDDLPEGFIYNCCEKSGESEGCKIGTHVESSSDYKRPRY